MRVLKIAKLQGLILVIKINHINYKYNDIMLLRYITVIFLFNFVEEGVPTVYEVSEVPENETSPVPPTKPSLMLRLAKKGGI